MVAVRPDPAGAIEQSVQCLCDPDRKTLHRSREGFAVLGLDENVQVVALNGVVHDPHAEADTRLPEGFLESIHHPLPPHVSDAASRAQCDVHRMIPGEVFAAQM